ncbi:MAG: hypothetical protein ACI8W8_001812 [Rhodothermales bacterium]|jgi:hypothetical protein
MDLSRQITLASLLFLLASCALADIKQGWPQLDHPYPKGGAQGETIQVALRGNNLSNPVDLVFYEPGFQLVRFIEPEKKGEKFKDLDGRERPWDTNRRVVCELRIPKDATLGEHHFRFMTEGGLSQMRTFWVGAYPSVLENEDPSSVEDDRQFAQELELGRTVNAVLHRFDIDIYKFTLKKGQRFTAEIEGYRLATWENRGVTDLQLVLKNEAGDEIANAFDSHLFLADPLLTTQIPADGNYYLRVSSEFPTAAGRNLPYRLHVGDFVRPSVIYPLGTQAGKETTVIVKGDPKGEFSYTFTPPKDADGDFPLMIPRDGKMPPTPSPFRVSSGANINEAEPNNSISAPNKGGDAYPIAFNGVIEKEGDIDCFRFSTKAATGPIRIRVYAQSLNSELDARIGLHRVVSKDGKESTQYVKTYDDAKAAELDYIRIDNQNRILLDPTTTVTSKIEWVLDIRDTHGRGGPQFTYRIEIEPITPHVFTYLKSFYNQHYNQTRNRICIPAGNRISTEVDIRPAYGFKHDCDLRLEARNLPAGVTMYAPIIPKGQTKAPVVFEAADGVPLQHALIDIVALPVDRKKKFSSGFQQCNTFTTIQNGYGLWHTKSNKLALAVLDPAPYRLSIETPKIDLLHDGEINLIVKIDRDEGFTDRVELNMDWYPGNTSKASSVRLEKGQQEARFRISANSKAEEGDYQFAIYAHSGAGNTRTGEKLMYTGTEHVPVRIAPAYLKANLARGKIGRGTIGMVKVKFEHLREFDGEARIKLRNFPRGVKATEEWFPITADTKEIDFSIECAADALMGMSRGLGCILEITKPNGGVMQQRSGYGYLRIDPQRAKAVAVVK